MSRQLKRRRARSRARGRRKLPVFPLIVGGIVVAFAIAFVLSRGGGGGDETSPVTVTGQALPQFVDRQNDPAVGMPAPEVEGETFEGDAIDILPGTPRGIVFLAHWCPTCQAEVPQVQAWVDGGGVPEGVELVSVSTQADRAASNYPPSEWLEREGWTAPVLVDDNSGTVGGAFGLSAFPFWVFVDADGNVVARHAGALSIPELEAAMTALSEGGPG